MGRKRTGGIDTKDGRTYARVTVTLTDGRTVRRRVRLDQGLSRVIAKREAKKLSKDSEGFRFDPKSKAVVGTAAAAPLVDAYHDRWAEDRERRGRVSERGRYENHIQPILGGKPMDKVTKDNARRLSSELDEKVLASSIHWTTAVKVWGVATKMFRDACTSKVASLRVLEVNPFVDVPGPDRGVRKGKQWLYPDEALRLLACVDVPLRWRRIYAVMMYLYLRPEELAVLECEDIDIAHGYVNIHRACDLRTGEIKPTKTKRSRPVPIPDALVPLLVAMMAEAGGKGRLIRSDDPKRKVAHGLPPVEDLAATLREHLLRAEVTRSDLHVASPGTKRMTFYDLRATGITWEVLAGTDHVRIMQRAGHTNFNTTLAYIRLVEALDFRGCAPFPTLPDSLIVAAHIGRVAGADRKSRSKKARNAASPTGFEGKNPGGRLSGSAANKALSPNQARPSPRVNDGAAKKTRPVPDRSVEEVRGALAVAATRGDTDEIRLLVGELERVEGVARKLRLVK